MKLTKLVKTMSENTKHKIDNGVSARKPFQLNYS